MANASADIPVRHERDAKTGSPLNGAQSVVQAQAPKRRVYVITLEDQRRLAAAKAGTTPSPRVWPDPHICGDPIGARAFPASGQRKILELGRNLEGEYYVRDYIQARNGGEYVTWHFDDIGAMYVVLCGVQVGQRIPGTLFRYLKARRLLFTRANNSKVL